MPDPRAFVIGHPIGHSRSPMMHGYWLERHGIAGRYEKRDVAPGALAEFFAAMRREGWIGCNVTIPHKLAVMEHLDRVDEVAAAMGAVNCIWWEDGALVGGNTDALGFVESLDHTVPGWDATAGRAVVLGAGGAARAAAYGLRGRGFSVALCNRTAGTARALALHLGEGVTGAGLDALEAELGAADLLVNTTSLGMAGQPSPDIDLSRLKPGAIVCDAVYVPLETGLLRAAKARGLRGVDGLGMLLYQGAEGFRRWFGVTPEVTVELRSLLAADIAARA